MMDQELHSLTHYFGTDEIEKTSKKTEKKKTDFSKHTETTNHIDSSIVMDPSGNGKSKQKEPEVCRIFSQTLVESKDFAATFFDSIGNEQSGNRIISNLEFPLINEESNKPQLSSSVEVDRRRDAWIPIERTRQALIAKAIALQGTYVMDSDLSTMPGVLLKEELGDAIGEAVEIALGEAEGAQRRSLAAADVTQDEKGLRELLQAGAYRAAINLTARLLSIYGQGVGQQGHPTKHSPHSLQLWFTRIALLVKTKVFNIAQAEAEPFGQLQQPDVFYQFHQGMYGGRTGSMAPFSFRLLLAELPMHCGKPKESLTKLFSMLATIRKMLGNLKKGRCEDGTPVEISETDKMDSIRLWIGREARVMHSIVNCSIFLKDYELAIDLLEHLCTREGAPKHTLLSALGRLHLQMGNITGAEVCFTEAAQMGPSGIREMVDRGLLAVAQQNFDDAYLLFQQAGNVEPTNIMILNNMGVCLLYGGHLKEAIAVLESAISSNPMHALHESLILNLCTLYDMESSRGIMKKFALLRQISEYCADAPTAILEKLYG